MTIEMFGFFQINIFVRPDKGHSLLYNQSTTTAKVYECNLNPKIITYFHPYDPNICTNPISWFNLNMNIKGRLLYITSAKNFTGITFLQKINREFQINLINNKPFTPRKNSIDKTLRLFNFQLHLFKKSLSSECRGLLTTSFILRQAMFS